MQKSIKIITSAIWTYVCLFKVLPLIISKAYNIRLLSINEYGPIIHEFDPYFNYRATEYLYENGWAKFITWFDYKSWYPLGRPVGTTIYPGMQVTAVFIKHHVLPNMSLNDICAYIPAWFGAIASVLTGFIAYECSLPLFDAKNASDDETSSVSPFGSILENIPLVSKLYSMIVIPLLQIITKGIIYIFGSDLGLSNQTLVPTIYKVRKIVDLSSPAMEIGLIAAGIMSIVPAHMMRSVGGGYDNESVANTAMTLTFYFWCRTLRGGVEYDSWRTVFWGVLSGLAYFYMVAVWGGYVFVINLIGIHAGILVLLGRFGPKLYKGYSIFYTVGTALAIQVPVVGWTPLKSLEQLGPAAVFGGFQLLAFCDYQRKKKNLTPIQTWKLRIVVFAIAAVAAGLAAFMLDHYYGYFGPISARVRGLFVKHTKTGNPLVDSVAEHQPASSQAYDQYLGEKIVQMVPIGFGLVALKYFHDSSSFLLVFGAATYFFSHKMVRLVLLTAPIASIFAGIVLGRLLSFFMYNIIGSVPCFFDILLIDDDDDDAVKDKDEVKKESEKSASSKSKNKADEEAEKKPSQPQNQQLNTARSIVCKLISAYAAYTILTKSILPEFEEFRGKSESIAASMSHPTIIMKAKLQSGQEVMVDDYRECYWWLRDNTPEDSRVMAWWDYGYQITAIANRTTIADGNTWNHEHIALLGRALTSSEKEGHRIARHMADYVLIWGGGGGDDLAKSPHLARIANSVYRSMCPNDPTCSRFGYTQRGGPSKMMAESLLFKLHGHGLKPGVSADPNRFKHRFSSEYGKCRIFKVLSVSKESKEWVADPKNRDCDAPGSWYCRGQYPPGMAKILSEKRDFSQLEDFNKDEDDSEYQKKYFENLEKKRRSAESYNDPRDDPSSGQKKQWKPARDVSAEMIEDLNSKFKDTEYTHQMWQLINGNHVREVYDILKINPELAHLRSGDGRGPMFWAMENGNEKIMRVLKKLGVSDSRKDTKGLTARDLMKRGEL